MTDIGLVVAMGSEVPDLLRNASSVQQVGPHRVRLLVSGIGAAKARQAAEALCRGDQGFHPECLLCLGFCGGARDGLAKGHLVIADTLAYRERRIELQAEQIAPAIRAAQGARHHVGTLRTFDHVVLSRRGVGAGEIAVDMESFAIAEVARCYQLPVSIVKAVSDMIPPRVNLRCLVDLILLDVSGAKKELDAFARRYFLSQETQE